MLLQETTFGHGPTNDLYRLANIHTTIRVLLEGTCDDDSRVRTACMHACAGLGVLTAERKQVGGRPDPAG